MKNKLFAIALLSASSLAMAAGTTEDPLYGGIYDGYSNLSYSAQGFAQGNEINTQGGFCSVTSAAGCGAPGFTTGINAAVGVSTAGVIEAGSGAGMNLAGNLNLIASPAVVVAGPPVSITANSGYNAGTYNYVQAATNGGYSVSGVTDPGSQGIVNGSSFAIQKADLGIAGSGTSSDASATSTKGTSNAFSGVIVGAQAMTPN